MTALRSDAPAPAASPPGVRGSRYAFLDLLRAVAAFAVVLYHLGYLGYTDGYLRLRYDELNGIARYGYLGVELFFMISGYVIPMSLRGRTWRDFAIGRFIRLYPTYWLCLALTTVAVAALPGARTLAVSPGEWFVNVTMLTPVFDARFVDTVYWSLLVEIQFYIVAAVAVSALGFERLSKALLGWLLLGTVVQVASFVVFHGRRVPFPGQEYIGYFCVGAALSAAHHGRARDLWVWLLFGLGLIAALGQSIAYAHVLGAHFNAFFDPRVAAAVVLASAAAVAVTRYVRLDLRTASFASLAGGTTYPLYLLHQHLSYALMNSFFSERHRWIALASDVAFVVALAALVYLRFDRPVRRRLTSLLIARGAAATERAPVL